jgi:hypothetical protein
MLSGVALSAAGLLERLTSCLQPAAFNGTGI